MERDKKGGGWRRWEREEEVWRRGRGVRDGKKEGVQFFFIPGIFSFFGGRREGEDTYIDMILLCPSLLNCKLFNFLWRKRTTRRRDAYI